MPSAIFPYTRHCIHCGLRQFSECFAAAPLESPSLAVLDCSLRFVWVNDTFAKYHGIPAPEHRNRNICDVAPELAPVFDSLLGCVRDDKGGIAFVKMSNAMAGAQQEWLITCYGVYDRSGAVAGLAAIMSEVSGHLRSAAKLPVAVQSICPQVGGCGQLSKRERAVLKQIADGKTSKEIATELGISLQTIASHRKNICRKLNRHSTADLVAHAVRFRDDGV